MRFRFTIHDLLWLTALVALALGWWLDHLRIERFAGKAIEVQRHNDKLEASRKTIMKELQGLLDQNRALKQQLVESIK
jgi:hypothetical protein